MTNEIRSTGLVNQPTGYSEVSGNGYRNGFITNFEKSKQLQRKSHALIPGGAHTYAKGDDQYPEMAPGFMARGKGCHVWDLDDNEYIEYGMGLRSVTLGHGFQPVIEAAYQQMQLGINFTRPSPVEVEAAEKLLSLTPYADMVKFGKNGSDVTTAAVKLARAYTGRDRVAVCADHPFFSTDDWFIGSTAMNAGIPQLVQDLTVKFNYNDIDSLEQMFTQYPGQIACMIMEVETTEGRPEPGYLENARRVCHENGALLIFDEIITGFRLNLGGVQNLHGVAPDLTTFGKAMGNGFSISALAGNREIMELGGLAQTKRERVFLLSQTYGAENQNLAAAIETMKFYQSVDVTGTMRKQGERLMVGVRQKIAEQGVEGYFEVIGHPSNLIYVTRDPEKQRSQWYRALFMQEIIKRGVIGPSFVISYAHSNDDVDRTIEVVGEALKVYGRALNDGAEKHLTGRPVKPVFRKFN
jgi:glutamate-1-semialdehyde 2,1-aminomutase